MHSYACPVRRGINRVVYDITSKPPGIGSSARELLDILSWSSYMSQLVAGAFRGEQGT